MILSLTSEPYSLVIITSEEPAVPLTTGTYPALSASPAPDAESVVANTLPPSRPIALESLVIILSMSSPSLISISYPLILTVPSIAAVTLPLSVTAPDLTTACLAS